MINFKSFLKKKPKKPIKKSLKKYTFFMIMLDDYNKLGHSEQQYLENILGSHTSNNVLYNGDLFGVEGMVKTVLWSKSKMQTSVLDAIMEILDKKRIRYRVS